MKSSNDLSSIDFEAYQAKIVSLIAGRDRIEILSRTPNAIAELIARNPADRWRVRPFEGKWTPSEILGHLADIEWVFGYRIRAILCEDEPEIHAMDHEAWVAGQRHHERAPAELFEMFRSVRPANLSFWRRVKKEDFTRGGLHNHRGRETLELNLTLHAGHDLSHIDQLTRYLAAAGEIP